MQGFTLVPLKIYFKENKAKVMLGVCRGKKNYDKRESIKERDQKREMQKASKYKNQYLWIAFFLFLWYNLEQSGMIWFRREYGRSRWQVVRLRYKQN